jgi:transposase
MLNTNKREIRNYSNEYKVEAVKLARQIGASKAAIELGIPEGTVSSWVHKAKKGAIDTGVGTQTPQIGLTQAAEIQRLKEENRALNKDNKRLREENEFLEEASAFFAASRQRLAKKSDSNI